MHCTCMPSQISRSHGDQAKSMKQLQNSTTEASNSCLVYLLSGLMSLLTLPPALIILKWYRPPRDKLVPALWTAVQINAWLQFSVYIASYQVSFSSYHTYLASAPQEVSTVLMSHSTISNYFVLGLAGMFLLELPLVMWYIACKVKMESSTQRTCPFHCRTMANSFGLTGIVFFLQIIGGYSVYFLSGLLAFPLFTVYSLALLAVANISLIALIALVIYPCTTRRWGQNCFQECGALLYICLGTVGAAGFTALLYTVVDDNLTAPLNSNQIASSIMSSCLFAVIAYIAKKTVWNYLWQPQTAIREHEEKQLLLKM